MRQDVAAIRGPNLTPGRSRRKRITIDGFSAPPLRAPSVLMGHCLGAESQPGGSSAGSSHDRRLRKRQMIPPPESLESVDNGSMYDRNE